MAIITVVRQAIYYYKYITMTTYDRYEGTGIEHREEKETSQALIFCNIPSFLQ
jgi:hypothetical protein